MKKHGLRYPTISEAAWRTYWRGQDYTQFLNAIRGFLGLDPILENGYREKKQVKPSF